MNVFELVGNSFNKVQNSCRIMYIYIHIVFAYYMYIYIFLNQIVSRNSKVSL